MKSSKLKWTSRDDASASEQGWILVQTDRMQGRTFTEIERLDDLLAFRPYGCTCLSMSTKSCCKVCLAVGFSKRAKLADTLFESDDEALAHVALGASLDRDRTCRKALRIISGL